jgi:hypothetical protein
MQTCKYINHPNQILHMEQANTHSNEGTGTCIKKSKKFFSQGNLSRLCVKITKYLEVHHTNAMKL